MDIVIFNVFCSKVTKLRNFNAEINILDTKDLLDIYERFARGRSGHREIKTNIRNDDISAIDTPPGCSWGSTDLEELIEFDCLGLKCDHQGLKQLEPKNHSKRDIFNKILLFLRGFCVLAPLNFDGRILNLENRILWVLPDL